MNNGFLIKRALLQQLEENKSCKIVFWGASLFLKEFLTENDLKDYNIAGIVDSDSQKWGMEFCNYTILSPDSLGVIQPVNVIFTIQNNNELIYDKVSNFITENNDLRSVKICPNIFTEMYRICMEDVKSNYKMDSGFKFLTPTADDIKGLQALGEDYKQYSEMHDQDRLFLYSMIQKVKPKKVLEVGVSSGGSSYIMLNALKNIKDSHLYSLDLANIQPFFQKNVGFYLDKYPELKQNWTLKTGKISLYFLDQIASDENEDEKFDFCFLDTAHVLPGELLDFLQILPYLKKDCVFLLHDINWHLSGIDDIENMVFYSNNILYTAIHGEKILPDQSVYPHYFGNFISNIGGIKLNKNTYENIFNVFNSLSIPWKWLPSEQDLENLLEFFYKHYGIYYACYFEQVVNKQKQLLKIRQDAMQTVDCI